MKEFNYRKFLTQQATGTLRIQNKISYYSYSNIWPPYSPFVFANEKETVNFYEQQ